MLAKCRVFARSFVGGVVHPFPTGFRLGSHQIVWATVSRYSDVFQALRNAKANSTRGRGVCPRSRGEVGVRLVCASGITAARRYLEEGMDARMKALPDGERRVTLRASDVPLALMAKLHLASRVVRTSRYSMAVALDVVGPAVSENLCMNPSQSAKFNAGGQSSPQCALVLHRQCPFRDDICRPPNR